MKDLSKECQFQFKIRLEIDDFCLAPKMKTDLSQVPKFTAIEENDDIQ